MPVVPAAGYPTGPEAPPAVPLSPPEDYQRIQPTPDAFGAQVGQSMSALGRVLTTSADEFAQVARERQDLHNNVVSDNQINNWADAAEKKFTGDPNAPPGSPEAIGLMGLRGEDAIKAFPKFYNDLKTSREQMRGQLENPMQQLEFDKQTRHQLQYLMTRAGTHYDQQYDVFQTQTNKASADLADQQLAQYVGNDEQFNAAIGRKMDAEYKQLQAAGLGNDNNSIWAMQGRIRSQAVDTEIKVYRGRNDTTNALRILNQESGPGGALSAADADRWRTLLSDANVDGAITRARSPGGGGGSQPNASKNLENFNFGNMKAAGGGWRTFASEEEGAQAIGDWLLRHNQGGQTTIRQLIDDPQRGYAPSADPGNTGKGLSEAAARIVGVGPDQPVDMSDPAVRRKMVGAIVQQEFGNPQTTQRALAAYDRAQGTTAAAPAGSAPSPSAIEVRGDSLGVGLKGRLGAAGTAVGGRTPTEILADIQAEPKGHWQGKTVVLPSGSNGNQMPVVEETIKYLQDQGAKVIAVGYGPRFPEKNAQLAEIAGRLNVPVIAAEDVSPSEGVHPSPRGYQSMADKIRAAAGIATGPPIPLVPPPAGGKPQTVSEGDIIHNPKTGEYLQNVGGKLVRYMPPGV